MTNSTAMQTYQAVGNIEDLSDVIYNISPEETPMLSNFAKVKATNTTHSWLTDTLATAGANAKIEGADYSFARKAPRTKVSNYVQLMQSSVEVSDLQRLVNSAGLADEFSYQMAKAMKEHARDFEYALVNGTGNAGASGTAAEMKGVLSFITTNVEVGTGTGNEALIEGMFNNALQTIWDSGGRPDAIYVNGFQKRAISSFTSSSTKFTTASSKELTNVVDVYDSDFGRLKIYLDAFMPAGTAAILQSDLWAVATLEPTHKVDVAKIGSATRAVIETAATLEARNEKGSGQITGLTTA